LFLSGCVNTRPEPDALVQDLNPTLLFGAFLIFRKEHRTSELRFKPFSVIWNNIHAPPTVIDNNKIMALKAIVYKAQLNISDMDRNVYANHQVTIARHPSETDERMMIRLLAFALQAPASNDNGALELAKDLWDADEPALWQLDLTGAITHWIDVGLPEDRRLMKASGRAISVTTYAFASSTDVWWKGIENKLSRLNNLTVWQIDADASAQLTALADRTMQLQVTVQDGSVWITTDKGAVEITPRKLSK
jgi:uncharacterized protein YaeQ